VNQTTTQQFPRIETWEIDITVDPPPPLTHKVITQNFVRAILRGDELIAPGTEGVKGLEIGNAMALAGLTRKPAELPLDAAAYQKFLDEMKARYGGTKKLAGAAKGGPVADPLAGAMGR
jgi:hypothetical protein